MANKLAVITDDEDPGAWVVMRGIDEVMKRHPQDIDVDYIDQINLGSLGDGEVLYIMGHGSPTLIHGGYDGSKVSSTIISRGLPQTKKARIRLLSCETGMYEKIGKIVIGSKMVERRDSLARDLKNALTQAKYQSCTLEVPIGNVVVLSATDGDNAILPNESGNAQSECESIFTGISGLDKVNPKILAEIKKGTSLANIAKTFASDPAVVKFFTAWNLYVKTVVYPGAEGWRIVAT
jgi:hypothetical protein